jgi:hypothetical protein
MCPLGKHALIAPAERELVGPRPGRGRKSPAGRRHPRGLAGAVCFVADRPSAVVTRSYLGTLH